MRVKQHTQILFAFFFFLLFFKQFHFLNSHLFSFPMLQQLMFRIALNTHYKKEIAFQSR